MEKLAENRFTITKRLFMEGMLRISRDSYGKSAAKAAAALLGLWVLVFLYTLLVKGDMDLCILSLFILSLALLWLCVGIPRSNARRRWKTLTEKGESPLIRTTLFYRDHLVVQGNDFEKEIGYGEIVQVLSTSGLLVLVCRDKTGILLALDGFTKGTKDEITAAIDSFNDKE